MNEETMKLVEELAAKLGTTAEHLWGVLCRQAPISAVVGLARDAALLWLVVLAWRKLSRVNFDKWDEDLVKGFLYGGLAIATAIAVVYAFSSLPMEIAGLFNPEYWAFKQVIK